MFTRRLIARQRTLNPFMLGRIQPSAPFNMAHNPASRVRAYSKAIQRRDAWLAENGPCQRCGSWDRLEVDHVDPSKKISHKVWSWSALRRAEELAKCQALCSDCHQEKTREDRMKNVPEHGIYGYNKRGCRCDICRSAINAHHREYRLTKWGTTSSRPRQSAGSSRVNQYGAGRVSA
jgi:hypothetical protein